MSLTGAKRAYGVGETKSQNAVIKVYTVDQLKNALTKIYQLPSGIGTIEICSDLVITEPIKLKRFIAGEKSREITIQGVSGVKIFNGNTLTNQGYNWNQAGNNYMPVFDYGTIGTTVQEYGTTTVKYIFKNLNINNGVITNRNPMPFGAFLAGNLGGNAVSASIAPTLIMQDINLYNTWNILGTYDTSNTFGTLQFHTYVNANIENILVTAPDNNPFNDYLHINNSNTGLINSTIKNISSYPPNTLFGVNTQIIINNNRNFKNNIIENIYANINISIPDPTNVGNNNMLINASIDENNQIDARNRFSFINCTSDLVGPIGNIYNSNSSYNAFGVKSSNTFNTPTTTFTAETVDIKFVTSAASSTPELQCLLGNIYRPTTRTEYEIDMKLTIRHVPTDASNAYHFKTTMSFDAGQNGTITGNSTIYANENIVGITGLTPTWNNTTKLLSISPRFSTDNLNCVCSFNIVGIYLPSNP
jgi:hypothetical protein